MHLLLRGHCLPISLEVHVCLVRAGKVFIQKSAVNLLSTVLDTPEFFWSAPDTMQALYKRVCEYVELDDRVEVLNNRFSVCLLPLCLLLLI